MKDILSSLFGFLKYILLIVAFGLVFYGIMITYARLEKSLVQAMPVFIPFILVLLTYIFSLVINGKNVSKNLLFNLTSVLVFTVIIIICLRAKFDTNMILYHRYQIHFNPSYFADNLAIIKALVYMVGFANIILLICNILEKDKQGKHEIGVNKTRELE